MEELITEGFPSSGVNVVDQLPNLKKLGLQKFKCTKHSGNNATLITVISINKHKYEELLGETGYISEKGFYSKALRINLSCRTISSPIFTSYDLL